MPETSEQLLQAYQEGLLHLADETRMFRDELLAATVLMEDLESIPQDDAQMRKDQETRAEQSLLIARAHLNEIGRRKNEFHNAGVWTDHEEEEYSNAQKKLRELEGIFYQKFGREVYKADTK